MTITVRREFGAAVWKGVCKTCESEAEAERSELRVEFDERERCEFAWVKCPVCGAGSVFGMLFYKKEKP